ncbi:MAG: HAD-IA family hydrolase [bacterium]|nr:HAD-IA family hydrolase [bacterium]
MSRTDRMIQAYLFDLDGTLLDTETLWLDAIQCFLDEREILLSHDDVLALAYGIPWHGIYLEITRRYPQLTHSKEEMSALIARHFIRLRKTRDIRILSSIELLIRLAEEYPVCIVSGSDDRFVKEGIETMGIGEMLRFYLAGEHYWPGKPDPAGYLMAAERLDVKPNACLVFEDSAAGVQSAKDAGMHCVALSRPGRPRQAIERADWVLNDLAEFSAEAYLRRFAARDQSSSG